MVRNEAKAEGLDGPGDAEVGAAEQRGGAAAVHAAGGRGGVRHECALRLAERGWLRGHPRSRKPRAASCIDPLAAAIHLSVIFWVK